MAYYIMAEEKRGTFRSLPITRAPMFNKTSNFVKDGACSIKEIDDFTTLFNDEYELKKFLAKEEILPIELIDKSLSIRTVSGETRKKVMYDFLYQRDIIELNNPEKLISRIMQKYYAGDFEFIKKLGNHFMENKSCNVSASDVRHYAEDSLLKGSRSSYFDEIDRNGYGVVERLLRILIYKHSFCANGKINYEMDELQDRNVHDLIAFTNYQENGSNKPLSQEQVKQMLAELKEDRISHTIITPIPKKRKLKQVEGQYSMF